MNASEKAAIERQDACLEDAVEALLEARRHERHGPGEPACDECLLLDQALGATRRLIDYQAGVLDQAAKAKAEAYWAGRATLVLGATDGPAVTRAATRLSAEIHGAMRAAEAAE